MKTIWKSIFLNCFLSSLVPVTETILKCTQKNRIKSNRQISKPVETTGHPTIDLGEWLITNKRFVTFTVSVLRMT